MTGYKSAQRNDRFYSVDRNSPKSTVILASSIVVAEDTRLRTQRKSIPASHSCVIHTRSMRRVRAGKKNRYARDSRVPVPCLQDRSLFATREINGSTGARKSRQSTIDVSATKSKRRPIATHATSFCIARFNNERPCLSRRCAWN